MPRSSAHRSLDRPLGDDEAEALAEAVRAFGTASRLHLLWALLGGEHTVAELVDATGLNLSAASHQLRLLRHERLVAVRREGRHAHYRHYDHHVADLLAALRDHLEHAAA